MRSRLPTAQRPLQASRIMAAALMLLFSAGQVLNLAHLLLVRHDRCAEHGELIDVRDGKAPPPAAQMGAAGARLTQAPLAESDHRHDHCASLTQRRQQGLTASLHATQAWMGPRTARLHLAPSVPPRPLLALYRLAPKTSPPV